MTAGLAGQSKTDATLIEQSLAEPEQFGVIFERYFSQIHQYLVRRVGTKIADDLAAEVFVAAFAQRQRYDLARDCARPWLYGIATNLAGSHLRQEQRRYRALARLGRPPGHPAMRTLIADRVSASAAGPALAGALAALDRGDRDVLLLVALADLSYPEVAESLGIPYGTVLLAAQPCAAAGCASRSAAPARPAAGARRSRSDPMNEPNPTRRSPEMDELTAVRQLLAEPPPPAPDVVTAARARLERATRGTGAPRWHAPRRPWRLAAAAGLAAAVAAGVVIAQVIAPGGASPAGALTVRELAYRAAAGRGRQPAVRPGQWVFWQEKTGARSCGTGCGTFHVWTTADAQKAAWVYRGKVVSIRFGPFIGQPQPSIVPQDRGGGWAVGGASGKIPVSYAGLSSLPRDPGALVRYLGQLSVPHRAGGVPRRPGRSPSSR